MEAAAAQAEDMELEAEAEERSKLEEVLCSEGDGLRLNRVTLHLDAEDVAALLQVNECIRRQLLSLEQLEGDDEAAEDPRELWYAMCDHKATALGVEHQHSALRSLLSKCEGWNADDDDRPDWLCRDLADDPVVYTRLLRSAVAAPQEDPRAALQRFAADSLVADRALVLQKLFNLDDHGEARGLRDSLLTHFASEMSAIAYYRAEDLKQRKEDREREEELRITQQTLLALLVCTLASLAPMLHDNLDDFGDTRFSTLYLHKSLADGYLSRPGKFRTVDETGRQSKPFELDEPVRLELALAIDALTLLVWWPQFRAHSQMGLLRGYVAAITTAEPHTEEGKLRMHAHFDGLAASLEAADRYAATGSPFPESESPAGLGGRHGVRLEHQPYVAAVLQRAGVHLHEL